MHCHAVPASTLNYMSNLYHNRAVIYAECYIHLIMRVNLS